MTVIRSRVGASIAALAAFSLSAGPALAQGWGWNDGWGRHRHRDRVDVGDVLTGILIVGGIAAVVSAASSHDRDRDRRRDDRRTRDDDYQSQSSGGYQSVPAQGPSWNQNGIGSAVDRCMTEIARGDGRDQVEGVSRAGDGWRVQGRTGEGRGFSCTVDASGRIRNISVEGEGG